MKVHEYKVIVWSTQNNTKSYCTHCIYPMLSKLIQLWFSFIDTFSDKILRSYSRKLCQMLPSVCTLESHDNIWLIRKFRRMIRCASFITAIYFGLKIYSYLCFGIIFNIYIYYDYSIFYITNNIIILHSYHIIIDYISISIFK